VLSTDLDPLVPDEEPVAVVVRWVEVVEVHGLWAVSDLRLCPLPVSRECGRQRESGSVVRQIGYKRGSHGCYNLLRAWVHSAKRWSELPVRYGCTQVDDRASGNNALGRRWDDTVALFPPALLVPTSTLPSILAATDGTHLRPTESPKTCPRSLSRFLPQSSRQRTKGRERIAMRHDSFTAHEQ
jgi:hypothetical protein